MATVTLDGVGPGRASRRPVVAQAARTLKFVTGTFAFDSSYPTGGEDITEIFDCFKELLGIQFSDEGAPITANAKIVNSFPVDYAGKKVLAFGDDTTTGVPAEVAATTNLSTLTGVRFVAWGY